MRSSAGYRPDIDGLRAVAVLLVIAFHCGTPGFGGGYVGVDVFFVVSGFLITRLLLEEIDRNQAVDWADFYARRVRRLLPAAVVVVVVTLVAGSWMLLPDGERQKLAQSSYFASIFSSNLYFYAQLTQYFQAGKYALLHTWSLGVEEQFYLALPAFFLLASWLARRAQSRLRWKEILAIGTLLSLFWSMERSGTLESAEYFSPLGRVYEFSAGMLLAFFAWERRRLEMTMVQASAAAACGAALVGVAAATFNMATTYPGSNAAVPVLGTLLLIQAGLETPRNPINRLLALPPLNYLGRISYSWYLWHWPPLALLSAYTLHEPRWGARVVVVIGSLLLAVLSYHYIEQPCRQTRSAWLRRPRNTFLFGGLAIATMVCFAFFVQTRADAAAAAPAYARLISDGRDVPVPGSEADWKERRKSWLAGEMHADFGKIGSDQLIVLFGDSHAAHIVPALAAYADRAGVAMRQITRNGCTAAAAEGPCAAFQAAAMGEIANEARSRKVRVVLSLRWHKLMRNGRLEPSAVQGVSRMLHELEARRIPVLLIGPVPFPGLMVPKCLYALGEPACRTSRHAVDVEARAVEAAFGKGKAPILDLRDFFCDTDECVQGRGGEALYLDDNHLSLTGALALAALIDPALDQLLGKQTRPEALTHGTRPLPH